MLWGGPRSGKSGFVGSLYGLLKLGLSTPRWTAHPKDALTTHTATELETAFRDLCAGGYRKTFVRAPVPLHVEIRKKQGETQLDTTTLYIVDPAGEFVTNESARNSPDGTTVYGLAAHSRGLIWLISVQQLRENRALTQAAILPELIALLEASNRKQIDRPVAICLSMIDQLSEDERRLAMTDPRSAFSAKIGAAVPRWFEALCPRHRFFAVSSRGLTADTVEPINVSEVLDWIVSEGRRPASPTPEPKRLWPFAKSLLVLTTIGGVSWGAMTVAPRLASEGTGSDGAGSPPSPTQQGSVRPPRTDVGSLTPSGRAPRAAAPPAPVGITDPIWRQATAAIDAAPPGSRSVASMRYARAHACVTARLGCDVRQIVQDYSWVRGYGTRSQRAEAKLALDSLRAISRSAAR